MHYLISLSNAFFALNTARLPSFLFWLERFTNYCFAFADVLSKQRDAPFNLPVRQAGGAIGAKMQLRLRDQLPVVAELCAAILKELRNLPRG